MFKDWYVQKMIEAHQQGKFTERNNYAKAAGIDMLQMFELINRE